MRSHKFLRRPTLVVTSVCCAGVLTLTACSESGTAPASSSPPPAPEIGVILPDNDTANRWGSADNVYLEQAFKEAGVSYVLEDADGDPEKFLQIANKMINDKVKVLLFVNVDGTSYEEIIESAEENDVVTIAYDFFPSGAGTNYYVAFDNESIGMKMGEGLVSCLQQGGPPSGSVALLNGDPGDPVASILKESYASAITAAGYTVGPDISVPGWRNDEAAALFEEAYDPSGGALVGVVAANDGMAGAVIEVLESSGTPLLPVSGQDATEDGLKRILLGTQCMTVYKPIRAQATTAAALAVAVARGDAAAIEALSPVEWNVGEPAPVDRVAPVSEGPGRGSVEMVVYIEPVSVFAANVKDVVADSGYITYDSVCSTPELVQRCAANGLVPQ